MTFRVRAEVKLSRFPSGERFVRTVVAGASKMLGALTEQGPAVLEAIVAEFANATHTYVDDEGWAPPHNQHHHCNCLRLRWYHPRHA